MALHMHQGSCRQELRSAIARFSLTSNKSPHVSKLLLIPVCVSKTELTYTTCAVRHGVQAERTCTFIQPPHGKHSSGTCAALRGAHCSSLLQCSSFSTACRFVGMCSSPRTELTCSCGSSFSELGAAATLEWKPALDNLLLLVSIALAYVAGIVTPSSPASPALTASTLSDKSREVPDKLEAAYEAVIVEEDVWSKARIKLSKCLDGADDVHEDIFGQGVQLSLQALARGPRLRLLLITLEQLNKEVCNWQQNESFLGSDWSKSMAQVLCGMVISICRSWMFEEHMQSMNTHFSTDEECSSTASGLPVMNNCPSEQLSETVNDHFSTQWNSSFESYLQNYDGSRSIMDSLQATGKAEFYSDFLYFMCCRHVRFNGLLNLKMFKKSESLILEDLIIFLADKASALYLDLICTGNPVCDTQWLSTVRHNVSSTRLLEKFRNEVALNGWLNTNFRTVVAMFEDRFDLWILNDITPGNDSSVEAKKQSKDRPKSVKETKRSKFVMGQHKLPVRRVRELRALSGWRYYFSLYLEFSDICGPLLTNIVTKLGEGLSFLLVILIGRSLGLVYRGIRQSVQWNSG